MAGRSEIWDSWEDMFWRRKARQVLEMKGGICVVGSFQRNEILYSYSEVAIDVLIYLVASAYPASNS